MQRRQSETRRRRRRNREQSKAKRITSNANMERTNQKTVVTSGQSALITCACSVPLECSLKQMMMMTIPVMMGILVGVIWHFNWSPRPHNEHATMTTTNRPRWCNITACWLTNWPASSYSSPLQLPPLFCVFVCDVPIIRFVLHPSHGN